MPQENVDQLSRVAVGHHQAGRLAEAEAIYRQILAQVPGHADALHLLGVLAGQTGRLDVAFDLISRAIAVNPGAAIYHCNLSDICRRAGHPEQAIACARRAIQLDPKDVHALHNLSAALIDAGQPDEAISGCRRVLELSPDFVEAHNNLGNALRAIGQLDAAIAAYRGAIALRPDYAEAHNNLGVTLNDQKHFEDAIAAFRRAIESKPDYADGHYNLGSVLKERGRFDEAISELWRAIELNPRIVKAHINLGAVLADRDRLDEAISSYRRAIELDPGSALAHGNLGDALMKKGLFGEASATLDRAIQLDPDLPLAHFNRALILLMRGDFQRGWPEYQWRARAQPPFMFSHDDLPRTEWNGGELQGRTILLHAEQGLGDTLQFVRYVPLVAARGGRIVLACQRELVRLFDGFPGVERIMTFGDPSSQFDFHCPLLSLPLAFSTDLNSIPAQTPYLRPDPKLADRWKLKIEPHRLKVGLVWAGASGHKLDRLRSITLPQLAPLADVPGVQFLSLQKGPAASQPRPPRLNLIDWTDELHDFADTAGLVANLDLVITVDTAVAHLAGAMGMRVWVLLPFVPDWRWLLNRDDSPWYPTLRLFRQKSRGDWAGVIQAVAEALKTLDKEP